MSFEFMVFAMTHAHWTYEPERATLHIPSTWPWTRRPELYVEMLGVEGPRAPARLFRVMRGHTALAWGLHHHHALSWVRGDAATTSLWPRMVTPQIDALWDKADPVGAWTRHFASELLRHPTSPLYPGTWRLARKASVAPAEYEDFTPLEERPPHDFDAFITHPWEGWVGLRRPSHGEAGRVKMWRKRARQGTLPPVLLWEIPTLHTSLVLDGHDRLQAAMLEDVEADVLALTQLSPMREADLDVIQREVWNHVARVHERGDPERFSRSTVHQLNHNLIDIYGDYGSCERVRCWPLRGGRERWLDELEARVEELQLPQERVVAQEMLWPRTHYHPPLPWYL